MSAEPPFGRDPLEITPATLDAIAARGVPVPRYERRALQRRIVHIGVGGFHRAHLAVYTHELAAAGSDWGIAGLGLLPGDAAMAAALGPQDCLYTSIERGPVEPTAAIVGTLVHYEYAAGKPDVVIDRLASPDASVISLTITESGYIIPAPDGSTFDLIARALARRRLEGLTPVTILSCDNVPGNGNVARAATTDAARRLDPSLESWIGDHCAFPNSMVDRITPVTTAADKDWLLSSHGIVDRWPVVSEPFRQWVIEDNFVNGRPRWEDVGVIFTDDVHAWELYKLRLLNAAHSSMAYLCALAGVERVHEAMAIPAVVSFLEALLFREAVPSLVAIPGHPREEYARIALRRFANPGIGDQIARLCIDGTAKFPNFLVPTIEFQLGCGGPVDRAALALAGWARYLGTVPPSEQAADAYAAEAQAFAASAIAEPGRFLEFARVFPPGVSDNERFRSSFAAAYRAIAHAGALEAMEASVDASHGEPAR
jgi:mannitol 2-dehydrogenase